MFDQSWRDDWRQTLGPAWAALLVLFVVCLFIGGFTIPLSDADLPMHLALGEWIVRHRAVPFVEPFAWTRAGAPYYAYSWLAQLVFFAVLRAFGPVGLHVLAGLIAGAIVLAGFFGGLVLSAVKRSLGAKDWGVMIEGHGGALDRMDSVTFAAPLFYHLVNYFFAR